LNGAWSTVAARFRPRRARLLGFPGHASRERASGGGTGVDVVFRSGVARSEAAGHHAIDTDVGRSARRTERRKRCSCSKGPKGSEENRPNRSSPVRTGHKYRSRQVAARPPIASPSATRCWRERPAVGQQRLGLELRADGSESGVLWRIVAAANQTTTTTRTIGARTARCGSAPYGRGR